MVTEVVSFSVRGRKSEDIERALKETLDIVTKQNGFQKAFWGWEVENPNTCRLLVDWNSVEAHQEFQKKDYYKPFVDRLDQLVNVAELQAFHAHLSTQPSDRATNWYDAPITEVFLAYFSPDYPASQQHTFEQNINKFVSTLEAQGSTHMGFAGGWAVEEIPVPSKYTKARVYVACFGWRSVTAHLEFRETPLFKANAHLVDQTEGLIHAQVVHFNGVRVEQGAGFQGVNP